MRADPFIEAAAGTRRDNPHFAHIEDKVLLADCQSCVEDCDRLDIDRAELERDREMVLG